MRLEDMLKNVSGITNKVINSNCWDGQYNVLEGIQVLQCKVNEIITAINNGIIKGDKGDTPNVKVGETTTLDPNSKATVSQTGDMLNPIFNFGIPKGEKGDKGDTGKASESINDNLIDTDHTFSSEKITTMFNSLQDVKGLKYGTDKDYLVMNGTKNGVIKDLKIKGKSLVNRFPKLSVINQESNNVNSWTKLKITWGGGSTIINCTDKTILLNLNKNDDFFTTLTLKPNEPFFGDYGENIQITQVVGQFNYGWTTDNKSQLQNIIVLEGDCRSSYPNTYFEGIASVGNGNEIEVLSRKEDGNLFDGEFMNGDIDDNNGVASESYKGNTITTNFNMCEGIKYNFKTESSSTYVIVYEYDINKNFIKRQSLPNNAIVEKTFSGNTRFFKVKFQGVNEVKLIVSKNSIVGSEIYKQDKKPILFKDVDGQWKPITELRGLNATSFDTIEAHSNGKTYYHKRLSTYTFNGTETVEDFGTTGINDTISFLINNIVDSVNNDVNRPDGNFINNKLPYKDVYSNRVNYGGMNVHLKGVRISVMKTDLETQNVAGMTKLLKKWYDEGNPLQIVYLLREEKVYEVNPLDLQSFENETMISFKYGVVNGESEFYIDSNLGSITLNTMERVSNIENEVFQVKKIVLNGDYRTLAESTYPQDFKEVK